MEFLMVVIVVAALLVLFLISLFLFIPPRFALIIVVLFIGIAILTNPEQERHQEKIKSVLITQMQKNESSKKDSLGLLGNVLVKSIFDEFVSQAVSADNYILFSLTRITWNGDTKVIGVGAFGKVFLPKEVEDKMAEVAKK